MIHEHTSVEGLAIRKILYIALILVTSFMTEALSTIKEDGKWGSHMKTERNKRKEDEL